jgi:hypothetical protein
VEDRTDVVSKTDDAVRRRSNDHSDERRPDADGTLTSREVLVSFS